MENVVSKQNTDGEIERSFRRCIFVLFSSQAKLYLEDGKHVMIDATVARLDFYGYV